MTDAKILVRSEMTELIALIKKHGLDDSVEIVADGLGLDLSVDYLGVNDDSLRVYKYDESEAHVEREESPTITNWESRRKHLEGLKK